MLNILAIIPARGGSKAIPLKNLYLLNKKPLIQYTIESAISSNIFKKIIVSSDSETILKFSKKFKNIYSHKRPKRYARDFSSTDSVVENVLDNELKKNNYYDYLCIIEPTSPLRSAKSLNNAYKFLEQNNANSLITVNLFNHYYGYIKNNKFIYKSKSFLPRQKRKKMYIETGTFYFVKSNYFLKYKKIRSKNPSYIEVPKIEITDINDFEDLKMAEKLIK